MYSKLFKIILLIVLLFSLGTYNVENANAETKVMWGKTELKLGQIKEYYPDGVQKGHPAYASKHDRDKDGWACEPSWR